MFYRVRKAWEDRNSQIGAFTIFQNALLQAELAVSSAAEKYYAGEPITDPSVMITDPGVYGWHTISPVDPDFQALSVHVYGG